MCDNEDLIEACKTGYYEKVLHLLQRNFTVHVRDSKQATPLYHSCCHGYYDISCALIQYGCDVNARVQWGSTALHAASDRGHIECVKLLVCSGADVTIKNNRGDTALHLSAYRGYIEIVKILIQYNSNLFLRNNNEKTAADEAEGNNHHNTAELLRQNMIAVQSNFGQCAIRQVREIPAQFSKTLPPSVHSPASMSLPPSSVSQNGNDNFVRYSSDLKRFTRQSAPVSSTDISARKAFRPSSQPLDKQYHLQTGQDRSENTRNISENGIRNGHSALGNFQNGSINMIDNNRIPLHVQGREAMENFAETLQLQLVKKNEECDLKDKKLKQLTLTIQEQNEQLKVIKLTCARLKEENEKLKQSGLVSSPTAKDDYNKQSSSGVNHQGILDALTLLKQRQQSCSANEQSLQTLKEVLKSKLLTHTPPTSLDTPNKEWRVGKDFLLLGDKPLNHYTDGKRDGSCSLVFLINHNKKEYVLKMMINLINLQASQHGDGHSLDQFLIQNFGTEHNIPINLPHHPNIVSIRHHYMGATDRFKKFLNLLIPTKIDVPIEMANRTSFLVMDKYPQTLKSFTEQLRSDCPGPNLGLNTKFLLQLLYQILSAVYHLQKNGVVHRDIKADNIFLDDHLRPVLTDFGFAKTMTSPDGSPVIITDGRQIYAGNNHAWAPELTRISRNGQIPDEIKTLQEVYGRADSYAVGRMFYSLLRPAGEEDTFPQSSINRPHYEDSEIPSLNGCYPDGLGYILHNLVLDNQVERMSERRAMLCIGTMLFYPKNGEIRIESDVLTYYQARIFTLLSTGDQLTRISNGQSLTMEQSVEVLSPYLESDFLLNTSPSEFWEIFQDFKLRNLL